MIRTGICSVTFRKLSFEQVIELVAKAKLDGIEWGGDVHAPPDAPPCALQTIREATEKAGLIVASYGSYYNVVKAEDHPNGFPPILDAAAALGTKVVRIWCGGDSDKADESVFQLAAERTAELARMAAKRDIVLAFEFHRGGLTDTVPSTIKLLKRIDQPNVKTYFQVYDRGGAATPQEELEELLPYLQNVHCHHIEGGKRRLVENGRTLWSSLMDVLKEGAFDGFMLIEFTLDDAEDNFLRDAAALRQITGRA